MKKSVFLGQIDSLALSVKNTSNQKVFLKDLLYRMYTLFSDNWNWNDFIGSVFTFGTSLRGYEIPAGFEKSFVAFIERNLEKLPYVQRAFTTVAVVGREKKYLTDIKIKLFSI